MTLKEYQEKAMETCMKSSDNFSYMMLNLVGEIGEFAGKIAKFIRKEKAYIDSNHLITEHGNQSLSLSEILDLEKELGDILWQLSGVCNVMGFNLDEIAQNNIDKLKSRKERNLIDGNGDNR